MAMAATAAPAPTRKGARGPAVAATNAAVGPPAEIPPSARWKATSGASSPRPASAPVPSSRAGTAAATALEVARMPSSGRHPAGVGAAGSCGPGDGQPLDAALEVRSQVGGLARVTEGGRAGQHLIEQRAHLGAGKVSAQAEVGAVTEHQVGIGVAANVKAAGCGEDGFVAVGRDE